MYQRTRTTRSSTLFWWRPNRRYMFGLDPRKSKEAVPESGRYRSAGPDFGLIDDSYDDADLPTAEHVVPKLWLPHEDDTALDNRFYKTQFRYLSESLARASTMDMLRRTPCRYLPSASKLPSIPWLKTNLDRIKLPPDPGCIYLRRRFCLVETISEDDVLRLCLYLSLNSMTCRKLGPSESMLEPEVRFTIGKGRCKNGPAMRVLSIQGRPGPTRRVHLLS